MGEPPPHRHLTGDTAGVPCAVVRPDLMLALDQAHVWHPYSAMPATDRPLAVDSARGVRLRLPAAELAYL